MEPTKLTRVQANDVFNEIRNLRLVPGDFTWDNTEKASTLTHTPTGYYFRFQSGLRGAVDVVAFWPDKDSLECGGLVVNWNQAILLAGEWLARVKIEATAPDLWGALRAEKALPAESMECENEPFTSQEKIEVTKRLTEIEQYLLRTADLQNEHRAFVRRRLEYLVGAVDRLGKRDWLHTALGIFFTIATGVALDSEGARDFYRFFVLQINQALGTAADAANQLLT